LVVEVGCLLPGIERAVQRVAVVDLQQQPPDPDGDLAVPGSCRGGGGLDPDLLHPLEHGLDSDPAAVIVLLLSGAGDGDQPPRAAHSSSQASTSGWL